MKPLYAFFMLLFMTMMVASISAAHADGLGAYQEKKILMAEKITVCTNLAVMAGNEVFWEYDFNEIIKYSYEVVHDVMSGFFSSNILPDQVDNKFGVPKLAYATAKMLGKDSDFATAMVLGQYAVLTNELAASAIKQAIEQKEDMVQKEVIMGIFIANECMKVLPKKE